MTLTSPIIDGLLPSVACVLALSACAFDVEVCASAAASFVPSSLPVSAHAGADNTSVASRARRTATANLQGLLLPGSRIFIPFVFLVGRDFDGSRVDR